MFPITEDTKINIPPTAVEVKITNIVNPYIMQMYELKDYSEKSEIMGKKIQYLLQQNQNELRTRRVKLGDTVIVHHGICKNFDLPAWYCRGILGYVNHENGRYTVFLPDYGISIEVSLNEFIRVPNNFIADEYLTSTIGIYDVLPTFAVLDDNRENIMNDETQITVTVVQNWSDKAVQFTRKLVGASHKILFDPLACDNQGRKFGEVYLFLEDYIFRLSEILVLNFFAVYLTDDIVELISDPNHEQKNVEIKNESIIIPYMYSNAVESISNDSKENDESGISGTEESNNMKKRKKGNQRAGVHTFAQNSLNLYKYKEDGQTVLVHSNIKCEKLTVLTAAEFPFKIHKVLNSQNITKVRRIQSYIWPAIMKGANVVAISSSGTGKTYGHAVPIASGLVQNEMIKTGNVPSALVLCSSTKEVFDMYELFTDLLCNFTYIKIVAAYNGKSERALAAEICNGCQLLIATPPFLARFMLKYKKSNILDLKCLRYLVLDKADIIFIKYTNAVMDLILHQKIINDKQRYIDVLPIQIVAVAQQWCVPLKNFVCHYMNNPHVCIDSCMEAVIYTGVKSRALISSSIEKGEKILKLLSDEEKMRRTLIICTLTEEVLELEKFLKSHDKKAIVAHGDMNVIKVDEVKNYWEKSVSGMYPILICTDEVLSDLAINNVDHLINYSLPPTSKRQFHYRFSTLMDNLMMGRKDSKVTILLDENNDLQLKSLLDPMKRLNIPIPKAWEISSTNFVVKEDRNKISHPICNKVKSLGFCPNKNFCSDRHCIINDVDVPTTNIRKGDEITLMVTFIHDASHFSARILDYTRVDENAKKITTPFETNFMALCTKMQKYYAVPQNWRHRKVIEVGQIYTLEQTMDNFKRVKILKITMRDASDHPMIVSVRCIDDGIVLDRIHVQDLLEIPEELAKWQSHIVEIFLAGIIPYDDEYDWNECANNRVQQWFSKYYKKSSYIYADVLLHIGDTIWVDKLENRSKVNGYPVLINSSLKSVLLEENHGAKSDDHIKQLNELCKKGIV